MIKLREKLVIGKTGKIKYLKKDGNLNVEIRDAHELFEEWLSFGQSCKVQFMPEEKQSMVPVFFIYTVTYSLLCMDRS